MGKDRRIRALRRTKRAEFLGVDGFLSEEAREQIRALAIKATGSAHRWRMALVRIARKNRRNSRA